MGDALAHDGESRIEVIGGNNKRQLYQSLSVFAFTLDTSGSNPTGIHIGEAMFIDLNERDVSRGIHNSPMSAATRMTRHLKRGHSLRIPVPHQRRPLRRLHLKLLLHLGH